jgi:hypothetical protein
MFQTKQTLLEALIRANTVIEGLRAENARLATHFDWLAAHVNELKIERAALLDRCMGIQLAAVPVIGRELPGADPAYAAHATTPNIGEVLNKARELVDEARKPGADRNSLVSAEMGGISFDDMGDENAAAAGLHHAPDGTVVSSR